MREKWTGQIVGDLHVFGITAKELAAEAGIHEKYLSQILNGHRTPKNARKTLRSALRRLIESRSPEPQKTSP